MTLDELIEKKDITHRVEFNSDTDTEAVFVGATDIPSEMWNLSDWKLTTVTGGSAWLRKVIED